MGLIYELFKPSYAGKDVYISLTKMFNLIKRELKIPEYFEKWRSQVFIRTKEPDPYYKMREECLMWLNSDLF